jgi:hypothetical protein
MLSGISKKDTPEARSSSLWRDEVQVPGIDSAAPGDSMAARAIGS